MDVSLRRADRTMTPQLIDLWEKCFGDSRRYISAFFAANPPEACCRVACVGDRVACAVYMIPFTLPDDTRGSYLYAGGTHPDFRGRGYYRAFMAHIVSREREAGRVLALMAEPHLRDFYKTVGYTGRIYARELRFPCTGTALPASLRDLTAGEYLPVRNAAFTAPASLLWDEKALSWALEETRLTGGFAHMITAGTITGAVIGRREGETLKILETTLSKTDLTAAAPALCAAYGTGEISALLWGEGDALTMLTAGFPENRGWAGLTLV